ncbi:hypothetical protein Rxycam_00993 [Rubrobacter xylanophilus DSM 9941]|nr:hypothetical protein Rxycam_00993 [Rubrobacter xylanophilus DSM 9941]
MLMQVYSNFCESEVLVALRDLLNQRDVYDCSAEDLALRLYQERYLDYIADEHEVEAALEALVLDVELLA